MSSVRTLVVAPHPDDEIIGCGGTLLRRVAEGAKVGWLIVTTLTEQGGWTSDRIAGRDREIDKVAEMAGFSEVFRLGLPTTRLDTLPMSDLVSRFSSVFTSFQPTEVLLPNRADAHSDHRVVFDAAAACTKWFRYPSVRRVLTYETMSETGFGLDTAAPFVPNTYVDISEHLERKLEIMSVYESELGAFPFPRSLESLRAAAALHGSNSGFHAAEAFCLLRERQ